MKSNKILSLIFWIICLVVLYGCGGGVTYKIDSINSSSNSSKRETSDKNTTKCHIYLDCSAGMRGYVERIGPPEQKFNFSTNVSNFIFELIDKYSKLELYTFKDTIKKKQIDKNQITQFINDPTNYNGINSKLDSLLYGIMDTISGKDLHVLITDGIIDIGKSSKDTLDTRYYLDPIYNYVKERWRRNKENGISAVVYQFLADFNGTYYFNYQNDGGKDQKKRPFFNQIMKNRPYYFFIIGEQNKIMNFISFYKNHNYSNLEVFNSKKITPVSVIIKSSSEGRGNCKLNIKDESFTINSAAKDKEISLLIGVNLNDIPNEYKSEDYLRNSMSVDPSPNNGFIEAEIFKVSELNKHFKTGIPKTLNEVKRFIDENSITDCIKITFNSIPSPNDFPHIIINSNKINERWISKCSTKDDRFNLFKVDSLQGKTFSLVSWLGAFDDIDFGRDTIFSIKFNKK